MPTKEQVLSALGGGQDYEAVARRLDIPAGQAYLIATGLPADGSDDPSDDASERPGVVSGSTQHLSYARQGPENPTERPQVLEWLRGRAQADARMRLAAAQRDPLPGEPQETEPSDVSTVLTREHDQVMALFKLLKTIPGASMGGTPVQRSRRESIVDVITVVLSRHEATEQEHFWPAVRSTLADGEALAGEAIAQEQEGKDVLVELGRLSPDDEEFDELAEKLELVSRKHVAFGDRILLRIETAMTPAARESLGARIQRAELRAPTRPHPHAPEHPAGAVTVAGAAASVLDLAPDTAGGRPAKRRGRASADVEEETEQHDEHGEA